MNFIISENQGRWHTIIIAIICLNAGFIKPAYAQSKIQNDLLAWCIVPFDAKERTPAQRIAMLQELGLTKYAYDWREKHLPEMAEEWVMAQNAGIELSAVWMWLDTDSDQIGRLSKDNERVLNTIETAGLRTQIWLGMHANYFEHLDEDQALASAVSMISYLTDRLDSLHCKLALYNHGGWFGQPANQIKIIESLPNKEIGIVYNFHHAHEHLEHFDSLVDMMLPHLWTVNLNGMKREGPKILPIGKGNLEQEMIRTVLEKGYKGPFGILGHVAEADVELILAENLKGLRTMK